MSLSALRWALGSGLRAHPQVVLIVLAYHHEPKTGDCFPSIKTIAAAAGIAQSSVKVALDKLESYGLIREEPRHHGGARLSSNWKLFIGARPNAKAGDEAPKKRFHLPEGEPESGRGGQPERYAPGEPESGQGGVSRSPATIGELSKGPKKEASQRGDFQSLRLIVGGAACA